MEKHWQKKNVLEKKETLFDCEKQDCYKKQYLGKKSYNFWKTSQVVHGKFLQLSFCLISEESKRKYDSIFLVLVLFEKYLVTPYHNCFEVALNVNIKEIINFACYFKPNIF